ncbi:hypothetical protein TNCV_2879481 [Trichonephila clavipes]|uniref:Uncharacterized protein n=1 Tax=Trichonephila clavipes TaxID=2585209 RepID=A0A8X6W226_TRICX|nr:hypothetical protein TNCV_2879481 [Trichonephila clavipes]
MASQFGEISLRNLCLAFIQLNFNFPQRVRSLIGKSSAFYAADCRRRDAHTTNLSHAQLHTPPSASIAHLHARRSVAWRFAFQKRVREKKGGVARERSVPKARSGPSSNYLEAVIMSSDQQPLSVSRCLPEGQGSTSPLPVVLSLNLSSPVKRKGRKETELS